jgi:phenylalanyl-tRNA synthetase beta chain
VPDLCPRFTARVFEDVTIAESPAWLKARLMAAGMRPISNVVDITNYAMLLTGQPLHAFDLDRVAGGRLVVRAARPGETIDTLDGQTRTLEAGEIVIDDADGPTSLAGVMGGARSEVGDGTTRVLMEVAAWHAPTIQRTSTRLGCAARPAGASRRAVGGQTMEAQAVAAQLMVELCGARLVPGTIDVGGPASPRADRAAPARVERLLGKPVDAERQVEILRSLEFGVETAADPVLRRRPALPRPRRHPRGRPRRGGRAHRRPRQPARRRCRRAGRRRRLTPAQRRAPPRRGRPRRPRPARDGRLVVHRADRRRPAAPAADDQRRAFVALVNR